MAPGGRPIRLLSGVAIAVALAVPALAAAASGRLAALVWTEPGAAYAVLAREPVACLSPGDADMIATGRALFNAPQLLGGQAARAGIACASCHANGRVSRHFRLDGISAGPGTADVSAAFFSPARDDRRFDPVPIPDLARPGKVSRDPASHALEPFLRRLIVEEFAGSEPSPRVLAALAAYVRAVQPCPGVADEPHRLAHELDLVRASLRGAIGLARAGDERSAALLVGAARHQLGLIDERFAGPRLAPARARLLAASRGLQPVATAAVPAPAKLAAWLARFDADLAPRLEAQEPRSLYKPSRLARWLGAG